MSTIVETPREPSHDELEALIEEARRRARRRRLLIGGVAVGALLLAGLVTGLVLVLGGGTSTAVPRGFHVVQARGPVQHALLETLPSGVTTVDLSTGQSRPTRGTVEIWWDPRLGLAREEYRQDGRLLGSFPRQNCIGSGPGRFCVPESPFDLQQKRLGWPPQAGFARRIGEGRFRGHRVEWLEGLVRANGRLYLSGDQVAYDMLTRRPVALRTIGRDPAPGHGPALNKRYKGKVFSLTALTMLPDLPAKDVSFVVPKHGVWRNPPSAATTITGQRIPAARKALGTTPLWLGRTFEGHRLQSVVAGIESEQAPNVGLLRPSRFARFDYGTFAIHEFGQDRPFWREQEPAKGSLLFSTSQVILARDGVLVNVEPVGVRFKIDRATALALSRALRPVDG